MSSVSFSRDGAQTSRSVPLRTVLERQDLALEVIVPAAPDTRVRWATVSELVDPSPYLLGGELLLTAGVNLPAAPAELDRYVASLVAAEVAAVGLGLTPVHDTVPDRLVERCRAHGMPLVRVPRETPFVAVSRAVGEELERLPPSRPSAAGKAERLATRLLLSSGSEAVPLTLLWELAPGAGTGEDFRVLHARWSGPDAPPAASPALFHTRLIDETGSPVRAVLSDLGDRDRHTALLAQLHADGWLAVLSGPVARTELATADRQAAALLLRARAANRPLLADDSPDPFDVLLDSENARAAARRLLGPLAGHSDSARTLRVTLRAWLARHGSWDRAAADLGAHRNSVRYRIGRVERALGVDLADPEQRMRLWFALSRFDGTD